MKRYLTFATTVVTILSAASTASAQSSSFEEEAEEQTVELSPFEVNSDSDRGYQAANTLAGSRLNTPLRDVASSVSVFNAAFIEDLGIQDIEELADYTTNMVLDFGEDNQGGVLTDREGTTATSTTQRLNVRGVPASQGMDYFRSITPSDGYRSGRYDDSRGPNSILFGTSNAGGILNASSIGASVAQNSGLIRLTTESEGGFRGELRLNRVLVEDKLAINFAAVHQENESDLENTFDDVDRYFGTVTWRPVDRLTVRVNYETGSEFVSNGTRSPMLDFGGMAFYDWSQYLSANGGDLNRLLVTPTGGNNLLPTETDKLGVYRRNTNPNNANRRLTLVTNDNAFYEDQGTFVFQSYGNQNVSAPPDANWVNGSATQGNRPRINAPDILPRTINVDGPGALKDYDFENYSVFVDFKVAENFYVNFSHNYQEVDLLAYNVGGFAFQLNADANLTRGLDTARNPGFEANPYAGKWYLESNWRKDIRRQDLEATRLSLSWDLDLGKFGNHRIGAMGARTEEFSYRTNQQQSLLGRPFNGNWNNPGNRPSIRTYFEFDDAINNTGSFHVGHWSALPGSVNVEGVEHTIDWTNRNPGGENRAGTQTIDTALLVAQSRFFNDKLVTTFGYRKDKSDILQFYNPNNVAELTAQELLTGPTPDFDLDSNSPLHDRFEFDSETTTAGVVYHVHDNLSLIANMSNSIGFPDFNRTLFPTGVPTPPPEGEGVDFGIGFNLLDNRISGRLVYYETDEIGLSDGAAAGGQYDRIVNLASSVVDEGILSQAEWDALDAERLYSRNGNNGDVRDKFSEGFELSLTANVTDNWRMVFNASKTDRIATNVRRLTAEHIGLVLDPDTDADLGQVLYPFDTTARTIDVSGFGSDGTISQLLGHIQTLIGTPSAGGATHVGAITTTGNNTVYSDLERTVANLNNTRLGQQKRWGLRPYRANLWNTYDFNEGRLRGFSVGAGVGWQDRMTIGQDETTQEVWKSRALWNTDAMIRYRWAEGVGPFDGRFSVQLNIKNLLDDDEIIPVSYMPSRGPRYELPYDRGEAYSTFSIPQGRSWRLSATYEF